MSSAQKNFDDFMMEPIARAMQLRKPLSQNPTPAEILAWLRGLEFRHRTRPCNRQSEFGLYAKAAADLIHKLTQEAA